MLQSWANVARAEGRRKIGRDEGKLERETINCLLSLVVIGRSYMTAGFVGSGAMLYGPPVPRLDVEPEHNLRDFKSTNIIFRFEHDESMFTLCD